MIDVAKLTEPKVETDQDDVSFGGRISRALEGRKQIPCWACGNTAWRIVDDDMRTGIMGHGINKQTIDVDELATYPIALLVCERCSTLWPMSAHVLLELHEEGRDILAKKDNP